MSTIFWQSFVMIVDFLIKAHFYKSLDWGAHLCSFLLSSKCAKFCQPTLLLSLTFFLIVCIGIGLFVFLFIYNQIIDPKVFGSGSALFDKVLW